VSGAGFSSVTRFSVLLFSSLELSEAASEFSVLFASADFVSSVLFITEVSLVLLFCDVPPSQPV